jgi:hypothetical protein
LVKDLQTSKVTEKEKMKYLMFIMVFPFLNYFVEPEELSVYDGFFALLNLVIILGGIYLCYKVNAANDDRSFLTRFLSLSVPLTIRISVCLIPVLLLLTPFADLVLFLIAKIFSLPYPPVDTELSPDLVAVGQRSIVVILNLIFFLFLRHYIKKAATPAAP